MTWTPMASPPPGLSLPDVANPRLVRTQFMLPEQNAGLAVSWLLTRDLLALPPASNFVLDLLVHTTRDRKQNKHPSIFNSFTHHSTQRF
jgi:hypothetical protein